LLLQDQSSLEKRLALLEQVEHVAPASVLRLHSDLDNLRAEAQNKSTSQVSETRVTNERVESLTRQIQQTSTELSHYRSTVDSWESWRSEQARYPFASLLSDFESSSRREWEDVRRLSNAALGLAERTHSAVADLRNGLNANQTRMWDELVGPVVQLAGRSTVGSGVLLRVSPEPSATNSRPFLLTAWHVVRDILADADEGDTAIPVTVFTSDGSLFFETATLLEQDAAMDVALLRLDGSLPASTGAVLAARERLGKTNVFDEIYAVGCPLGNDPIPTRGEIVDVDHVVDGESYWMISAPTYIGNSGGGIFDAQTHELLGVFSKIYTHGSLRPTVIPHMGLATPLDSIHAWLEDGGYLDTSSNLASSGQASIRIASATR
jgi:S1-C subfamily serine protease